MDEAQIRRMIRACWEDLHGVQADLLQRHWVRPGVRGGEPRSRYTPLSHAPALLDDADAQLRRVLADFAAGSGGWPAIAERAKPGVDRAAYRMHHIAQELDSVLYGEPDAVARVSDHDELVSLERRVWSIVGRLRDLASNLGVSGAASRAPNPPEDGGASEGDSAFEPHEGWETLETDTVTKADGRNWTVAVQGWTHGRGRGPFRVIYREGAHGRFSGHPVGHWVIGGYNPANRELLGRRAASVMRDNLIVTLGGRRQEGRWVVDASRVPAGWEFETAPGRAENPDRERYGHQYSYSVQLQLLAIVRFLAFFTQGSSTLLERVNTLVDDVNTTADKPWPTTEEFQAFVKRAKALAVSVERKWPADTDAHNQMVLAVHALSGLPHLWSLRKRDRLTEAGLETDNG